MSILNVEHLSHGFGDRAIFQDVSFRLLKGEHIGLVGANGEGKSTFNAGSDFPELHKDPEHIYKQFRPDDQQAVPHCKDRRCFG